MITALLKFSLFSHIILGVAAVAAAYAVLMSLLKRESNIRFLETVSLGGLVVLLLSWITGAYYYVIYYGPAVRDVIKKGPYPWAHSIVMEAKEHVFLFLPFLFVALFLSIIAGRTFLNQNLMFKRSLIAVAAILTIISVSIALAGMGISGAAR